jgi:hypothetical protein
MAKRFIDTDVFKKQFLRDLKPTYKLFWFYITNDCNHAGIWECDFDVAGLRIGQKVDAATALKAFKTKIVELDGGAKWFIPSFIEFQYGQLSEKNRAHTHVISILKKYELIDDELRIIHQAPYKPLTSPLQGAKDMEKEKDKEKEQEKEKDKEQEKVKGAKEKKQLINPFSDSFLQQWEIWKDYKREELGFTYKSVITEQAALNELVELSKGDEIVARKIIMQSISKKWKGLFILKNENNGTRVIPIDKSILAEELNQLYR